MTPHRPILHDYWRSSASYRVRIALNLLGRPYTSREVSLPSGAHRAPEHLAINPQGLVPVLEIDGHALTQSLAIIEYLHATTPGSALLPSDPLGQSRVRQLAHAIAMEIHPVCNLSVAAHVVELTGGGDAVRRGWMQHFITKGLAAVEGMLGQGAPGAFCLGDGPTMADCCLVPQLYNAQRWGADLTGLEHINRIAAAAEEHPAFAAAHPDRIRP